MNSYLSKKVFFSNYFSILLLVLPKRIISQNIESILESTVEDKIAATVA